MNSKAKTQQSVRRLAKVLQGPDETPQIMSCTNGTVSLVEPGASVDGIAQVTVTVNGNDVLAPYLTDAYPSPTVGDVVTVLFVNGSPRILGRIGGNPTF